MTFKHSDSTHRHFRWNKTRVQYVDPPFESEFEDTGYQYTTLTTEFTGEDNARYKEVIRSGHGASNEAQGIKARLAADNIGNSYRQTILYAFDDEGNRKVDSISRDETRGHDFAFESLGYPSSEGVAEDIAKTRFVSEARKKTTEFQGGVFLGELRETIHAIKHPADAIRKGLGDYLSAVKKRSRGFKGKSSYGAARRMVGGTWLEYAFGWAPLLHDVQSAAEALAKFNGGFTPNLKVRGFGRHDAEAYELDTGVGTWYGDYVGKIRHSTQTKASVYGAMKTIVSTDAPTFRGSFGLRARDVIPTIWELIPFSFVTDYFTNVGDIINAGCYSGEDLSWSSMSVKTTTTRKSGELHLLPGSRPESSPPYTEVTGSATLGSFSQEASSFYREKNVGLTPQLRFTVPGIRQAFNLAALFASSTRTSQEFARSLRIG